MTCSDKGPPLSPEGDLYHFFEICIAGIGKSLYLGGPKEVASSWMAEAIALKARAPESLKNKSTLRIPLINRHKSKMFEQVRSKDSKLILNHHKLIFSSNAAAAPCTLAMALLEEILSIFQEYTDQKCLLTPKVLLRLQAFGEQASALQILQLNTLSTHAEQLSFL
jgi:hypothetical protein